MPIRRYLELKIVAQYDFPEVGRVWAAESDFSSLETFPRDMAKNTFRRDVPKMSQSRTLSVSSGALLNAIFILDEKADTENSGISQKPKYGPNSMALVMLSPLFPSHDRLRHPFGLNGGK